MRQANCIRKKSQPETSGNEKLYTKGNVITGKDLT